MALEKMANCLTPREKLACLSESHSSLKTAVVDFHKGKVSFVVFISQMELDAMDDILPLTIYVVSQAKIVNLASELALLEDFIKVCDELGPHKNGGLNCELEKKLITNYSCGVIYVSKEWEVPASKKD